MQRGWMARFGGLRAVGGDEGQSLIELALVLPLLLLLVVGAVDMGRAYDAAVQVSSSAVAGAIYGTQMPTDVVGMVGAAKLDAAALPTLVPVATWGCECSDGSSVTPLCVVAPSCAVNAVRYVQVTTVATYVPLLPWPGIPAALVLRGRAKMRAAN